MRIKATLSIVFLALCIAACGRGGKYADIKDTLNTLIDIQESYISSMEKAQNAKDVATAINRYTDGFFRIKPRLDSFGERYPELKTQKQPPEELKEIYDRLTQTGVKFVNTLPTLIKYRSDPEVQQARERLKGVNK